MKYLESFCGRVSLRQGLLAHWGFGFLIRLGFILYISLTQLSSEADPVDRTLFAIALVILILIEVSIIALLIGIWKRLPKLFWPILVMNVVLFFYGLAVSIYFFTQPDKLTIGIGILFFVIIEPYFQYATLSHYKQLTKGVTISTTTIP